MSEGGGCGKGKRKGVHSTCVCVLAGVCVCVSVSVSHPQTHTHTQNLSSIFAIRLPSQWSVWSVPLLLESRATAPEPPTNVRATAVDATSARIAFTPGFDNGSKATQYRVLYARADKLEAEAADGAVGNHGEGSSKSLWKTVTRRQADAAIASLTPNTKYVVKVEVRAVVSDHIHLSPL